MSRAKKKSNKPKPADLQAVLDLRNKILESTPEDQKVKVHEDCKGLYSCHKQASEEEKRKCYENIIAKLKKHEVKGSAKIKKGKGERSRSRSKRRK